MQTTHVFKPSPRYLTRIRVVITAWAILILIIGLIVAGLTSLDIFHTNQATMILQIVSVGDLLWYLPAMKLARDSYETRSYIVGEEEIIIKSGLWTKSIRRIPLSSVVTFVLRWDWLDRWLEIGTLEVQTGNGPKGTLAHARLSGLTDVDSVAHLANCFLRHMRSENLMERAYPTSNPAHNMFGL